MGQAEYSVPKPEVIDTSNKPKEQQTNEKKEISLCQRIKNFFIKKK